jgi:ABC-2 type transport system permease protein
MSNVKAWQYILGTGIYVLGMCLIGTTVMALATGMPKGDLPVYYGFMTFGFIVSILIGAAIGMYGKNQMAAQSVATSVMLVIGFMPTLATFNETIQKIARFLYNQQIINIFSDMSIDNLGTKSVIILIASVIFAVAVFCGAFKKKGLE